MSARSHYEWQLVGYDADPVPRSEHEVDDVADAMRDRATTVASVRDTLRGLADLDGWKGVAAEEFSSKAGKVLEDLGKVVDRYSDVADALDWWAGKVGEARSATAAAVANAEEADRRVRANTTEVGNGADPSPEQLTEQSAADSRRHAAESDLADARTAMRNAMDDLDAAAETAKGKIDAAADIWDDGRWGDVKGFLRKGAELVEVMCKALEILGALIGAIILVLVLTIGAPVWLLVAALAIAVAVLVGHLFLMMVDEGDVSKETILLDLANVALSVTGLKGVTSAISGLKGAVPAIAARMGSTSRLSVISRLSSGQTRLYENALRFANPTGRLSQWAQGIRTQGDIAEITTRLRVMNVLDQQPGRLAVLLHQDREIAQLHKLVSGMRNLDLTMLEAGQVRLAHQQLMVALGSTTGLNAIAAYQAPELPEKIGDVSDYVRDLPVFDLRPVP